MKISNAELKVVRFNSEDVIATSRYFMSAAAFESLYGLGLTGTDYVSFTGSMTSYDDVAGGWSVTPNLSSAAEYDNEEMEGVMSGGDFYFAELGVWVHSDAMANIAKQHYDAYSYEGGLYTKGATYYETYWQ